MYGIVIKGLKDLVVTHFGSSAWDDVREHAGLTECDFQNLTSYPDEVMYRVIGAASAKFELTPTQILEEFGRHWIRYMGAGEYGKVLELYSRGDQPVRALLNSLGRLHTAMSVSMPDADMPQFECEELTEDLLRLHYRNSRIGLAPMVVGFVRALGERFDQPVNISREQCTEDGAEHDTFLVEIKLL